jgi:hypothetical protein
MNADMVLVRADVGMDDFVVQGREAEYIVIDERECAGSSGRFPMLSFLHFLIDNLLVTDTPFCHDMD